MSDYRELPPPAALADVVQCTWIQTAGSVTHTERTRVVVDGCADIVWAAGQPPEIVGPATAPIIATIPPGGMVHGVRLRPGAAPALLGVPVSEIVDLAVPLAEIWGRHVVEPLCEAPFSGDRLARLTALLLARRCDAQPIDLAVADAIVRLRRSVSVEGLADDVALSDRQLRRRFHAAVGYAPKHFQRVLRFQSFLRRSRTAALPTIGLAGLARATGYADQAHLSREVMELAGLPPAALLREMSVSYKTAP